MTKRTYAYRDGKVVEITKGWRATETFAMLDIHSTGQRLSREPRDGKRLPITRERWIALFDLVGANLVRSVAYYLAEEKWPAYIAAKVGISEVMAEKAYAFYWGVLSQSRFVNPPTFRCLMQTKYGGPQLEEQRQARNRSRASWEGWVLPKSQSEAEELLEDYRKIEIEVDRKISILEQEERALREKLSLCTRRNQGHLEERSRLRERMYLLLKKLGMAGDPLETALGITGDRREE